MSEDAVRWPSFCDLCGEYTTTPEHCSHCGHTLHAVVPPEVPPPGPPHPTTPFAEAAASRRVEHRGLLAELAQWALAEGRRVDLDVAAVCVHALDRQRTEGGIHLDRRQVNWIMWGAVRNEVSPRRALLPDTWIEDLWTVLRFLVATERLTSDSDPEPALLEPLQCYGGLGADGRERPDGVDVDFFCQCHHPHDPTCPPGMVQVSLGRDWDDHFEYVGYAHGIPRSVDIPMSAYEPLAKLARRHRAQPAMFNVALDQFDHLGTVPADREVSKLWLYLFTPARKRGWPPLALDEHGRAWRAKRHRGRRRGFRWTSVDDRSAAHLCGLASWEFDREHREQELLEQWEDDGPLRSVEP